MEHRTFGLSYQAQQKVQKLQEEKQKRKEERRARRAHAASETDYDDAVSTSSSTLSGTPQASISTREAQKLANPDSSLHTASKSRLMTQKKEGMFRLAAAEKPETKSRFKFGRKTTPGSSSTNLAETTQTPALRPALAKVPTGSSVSSLSITTRSSSLPNLDDVTLARTSGRLSTSQLEHSGASLVIGVSVLGRAATNSSDWPARGSHSLSREVSRVNSVAGLTPPSSGPTSRQTSVCLTSKKYEPSATLFTEKSEMAGKKQDVEQSITEELDTSDRLPPTRKYAASVASVDPLTTSVDAISEHRAGSVGTPRGPTDKIPIAARLSPEAIATQLKLAQILPVAINEPAPALRDKWKKMLKFLVKQHPQDPVIFASTRMYALQQFRQGFMSLKFALLLTRNVFVGCELLPEEMIQRIVLGYLQEMKEDMMERLRRILEEGGTDQTKHSATLSSLPHPSTVDWLSVFLDERAADVDPNFVLREIHIFEKRTEDLNLAELYFIQIMKKMNSNSLLNLTVEKHLLEKLSERETGKSTSHDPGRPFASYANLASTTSSGFSTPLVKPKAAPKGEIRVMNYNKVFCHLLTWQLCFDQIYFKVYESGYHNELSLDTLIPLLMYLLKDTPREGLYDVYLQPTDWEAEVQPEERSEERPVKSVGFDATLLHLEMLRRVGDGNSTHRSQARQGLVFHHATQREKVKYHQLLPSSGECSNSRHIRASVVRGDTTCTALTKPWGPRNARYLVHPLATIPLGLFDCIMSLDFWYQVPLARYEEILSHFYRILDLDRGFLQLSLFDVKLMNATQEDDPNLLEEFYHTIADSMERLGYDPHSPRTVIPMLRKIGFRTVKYSVVAFDKSNEMIESLLKFWEMRLDHRFLNASGLEGGAQDAEVRATSNLEKIEANWNERGSNYLVNVIAEK
ncbi:hypothetical protein BABINDRAFT_163035 [Babjeviella inositovora NRRL Y-12698]|uniref:Uncharacterized protein n=1 Tax=Babjeviella inositovora NRRL Y-12698 TaxID=984486 RepID=A0A1E3QJX1_9ASCO|nr:uncharacterized protein BABINDRAFT_163035 [Babjeviella inositovora NRRL Y-12698]ODQ77985.1 hypothetical protein BABINDRAFT_163035 [Babjeviella inositovora NRRL Y-12698]